MPTATDAAHYLTREEWLVALVVRCRHMFDPARDARLEPVRGEVRISCGFPVGSRSAIGQMWAATASADGTSEIFVSPVLADPARVAETVVHELCHVAAGIEAKHGPGFRKVARAVGLEGKLTATHAGPALAGELADIIAILGPYPHAELVPTRPEKKQSTRMLKLTCECGYLVRTTAKHVASGLPTCPSGHTLEPTEAPEEGDDGEG